jgi:hypothetical protein
MSRQKACFDILLIPIFIFLLKAKKVTRFEQNEKLLFNLTEWKKVKKLNQAISQL